VGGKDATSTDFSLGQLRMDAFLTLVHQHYGLPCAIFVAVLVAIAKGVRVLYVWLKPHGESILSNLRDLLLALRLQGDRQTTALERQTVALEQQTQTLNNLSVMVADIHSSTVGDDGRFGDADDTDESDDDDDSDEPLQAYPLRVEGT
jgi:hypothetical protein